MSKPTKRETLPASPDAERGVIGSILIAPQYALGACENAGVSALHFHSGALGMLFTVLRSMHASNAPIDPVTLTLELSRLGLLADIGGAVNVSELFTLLPSAANVGSYIAAIDEMRKRRELIAVSSDAHSRAYDLAEPVEHLIAGVENRVLAIRNEAALENGNRTEDATQKVIDQIDRRLTGKQKEIGMLTGIPSWDSALYGIFPSTFMVLAARPAVGKTSMMENVIQMRLECGDAVAVFEKDMGLEILIGRMACRSAGLVYEDYATGALDLPELQRVRAEVRKLQKFADKLRLFNPDFLSADQLAVIVKKEINQNGIAVWFLDHFQHLRYDARNIVDGLTEASRTIRRLIDTTGVPGVVIAQISKEADKGGRPHAGQIKYCDQLFSDCDQMALLWSDDDAKQLEPNERQIIHFTVDKNRIGPESDNKMHFWRERMLFEQIA